MKNQIKIAILLAILGAQCTPQKAPINEAPISKSNTLVTLTAAQLKNTSVRIGKAEKKSISATLKLNGTIDVPPQNMVSVSAPMGGYLKGTKLLPGMPIQRGEVIATLEDPQFITLQQDYLMSRVRLNMLKVEYERQKELNQSKVGSDKVFQQAEMEYKKENITVKALSEKLKIIGINPDAFTENSISRIIYLYSPISGFVSKVNVNIGKYLSPTDVLFELVNPTDIHLNLKVYEKDIDKLYIGQKATTWTNNKPNVKYNCEVILIGRNLDVDKTVEVHCHFEKYDPALIPGMYMNAEMKMQFTDSYVLPENAVINDGNKSYCFVQKSDNTFELLEIQKGISENGFTAISLLEKGKIEPINFVVNGAYNLWMVLKNSGE